MQATIECCVWLLRHQHNKHSHNREDTNQGFAKMDSIVCLSRVQGKGDRTGEVA